MTIGAFLPPSFKPRDWCWEFFQGVAFWDFVNSLEMWGGGGGRDPLKTGFILTLCMGGRMEFTQVTMMLLTKLEIAVDQVSCLQLC